jgi:ankyrin repeat protein
MSQKRQAQVSVVELQQEHRHDEDSDNKCARGAEGNDQHQQQQDPGLNVDCKHSINLPPLPPMQDDDPIITQFKPVNGQWELTEDNINRIGPETGRTILHNYYAHINTTPLEVYRYLIEIKGCDVNAQNKFNNTPLYHALRCFDPNKGGDITVLMYLLSQKSINGDIKGYNGYTLLHMACQNINSLPIDIFKVLIERMGCDVNAKGNNNNTPIHNALSCFDPNDSGDITVLTYLLIQKGINDDINDNYGYTLLHAACDNINRLPIEVFKLLIETKGCDVNGQDNGNNTPIHRALCYFDPRNGGDITVLHYLLTQTNVNVNIVGKRGYTLLHTVCDNINNLPIDVFKFLIETLGCDVNAKNNNKNTPLHHALKHSNPHNGDNITVLAYLINQNNVNLNMKNEKGCNLLHSACTNNLPSYEHSVELNAEYDTVFCQIVEVIVERCIQQILDETAL